MALSRGDNVLQSVREWLDAYLTGLGYADSYELGKTAGEVARNPLETTVIVVGNPKNDSPDELECGGPLLSVRRTIMIDVFGKSERLGNNIANHIHELFSDCYSVPLRDYSTSAAVVIDYMQVDNTLKNRLFFANPEPWQEHWHSVTVAINDTYNRGDSADQTVILDGGGA